MAQRKIMTPLETAEAELARVVKAAEDRKNSPVFGYVTLGSLYPDQAKALLDELQRLRQTRNVK